MKNRTSTLFLTVIILLMISWAPSEKKDPLTLYGQIDRSSAPNTLVEKEKKAGWNLLFDGKTTDGWHGYNLKSFPDCWIIENGIFTTTTKGGAESQDIITNKKYRSFALSVDYCNFFLFLSSL